MKFKIIFYVHHHGLGHLMRTIQIVSKLKDYEVILMGSNLKAQQDLLNEHLKIIHLPLDVPESKDTYYMDENSVATFHYAPLNVSGIRNRSAIMTAVFRQEHPMILIVDVSVEVALLARLCGIPTIIIRQHGKRDDLPHLMAYQSAELLLAPYPESLYKGSKDLSYAKTVFAGGFSKFKNPVNHNSELPNHVAVLIGGGGSSIDAHFISSLAGKCPDFFFHILGKTMGNLPDLSNVKWYGHLNDPQSVIEGCKIVIGNTGHNTVMEVASLNKRFIGIPEERPFNEQWEKAEALSSRDGIRIVLPGKLLKLDWQSSLTALLNQSPDWKGVIDDEALNKMANAIIKTGERIFY